MYYRQETRKTKSDSLSFQLCYGMNHSSRQDSSTARKRSNPSEQYRCEYCTVGLTRHTLMSCLCVQRTCFSDFYSNTLALVSPILNFKKKKLTEIKSILDLTACFGTNRPEKAPLQGPSSCLSRQVGEGWNSLRLAGSAVT